MTDEAMTAAKLLPCPFCGTKGYPHERRRNECVTESIIECGGCGCEMAGIDAADVARQWNTRTLARQSVGVEEMVRPIIGIENRTAQEAFDIMCDRILSRLTRSVRTSDLTEEEVKAIRDAKP